MTSPISAIDTNIAASYLVTTSIKLNTLTNLTMRRLEEYGINVEEIESEEEAQEILNKKEAEAAEKTQQTQSSQNAETYYDKQIMSDAINLASDLGLYIGSDTDIETLMDNIQNRLAQLEETVGNNENLKSVVDEYTNRYDYIYAQYMNKKSTLSTQVLTSLDVMGTNNMVSTGL